MYRGFYGAGDSAFALTPDPRFFYRSPGHEAALSHLLYGILEGGSFVLLTGEVGTGKTSACRYQINHLPVNVEVALILNPRLSEVELLASICDELGVAYPTGTTSLKVLTDHLNRHLLVAHAAGRQVVVIIDEAQNLRPAVLEEIRLLTNLQTETDMLLQIILIGQPELSELLERRDLRQLNQRITGRYHLKPLSAEETEAYIRHRLIVGELAPDLFTPAAIKEIHKRAGGVPRLINRICNCCLLGMKIEEVDCVDLALARSAVQETLGEQRSPLIRQLAQQRGKIAAAAAVVALLAVLPAGVEIAPAIFAGTEEVPSRTAEEVPAKSTALLQQPVTQPQETEKLALRQSAPPSAAAQVALPATFAPALPPVPQSPGPQGATDILRLGSMGPLFQVHALSADRETALSAFLARWPGAQDMLRGDNACEAATAAGGLACLQVPAGAWDQLADHNRPALITFADSAGRRLHAVVTNLTGEEVTLLFGKLQVRLAKETVTPYWFGPALILREPGMPAADSLSANSKS